MCELVGLAVTGLKRVRSGSVSLGPLPVGRGAICAATRSSEKRGAARRRRLVTKLDQLRDALRAFTAARDWDPFHSPKNLAMALSVEAAELLEVFQWMTEAHSRNLDAGREGGGERGDRRRAAVPDPAERRARHRSGRRRPSASWSRTREKYPVDKARGNSKKYTEL